MLSSVFQRPPCASVDVCVVQSARHYHISSSVIRRVYINVIPPRDTQITIITLKVIPHIVLFDEITNSRVFSVVFFLLLLFKLVLVQLT